MEINVNGLDKTHEKAINKGFAPWNIYKMFKHKDGGVIQLMYIGYEFAGDVTAVFETAGHKFTKQIHHDLDDYEMITED